MVPYQKIKDAIITGEIEPGKRLTEEALAEKFNVSRTPIREAIKQLETEGLVIPYKRRGVIVREFSLKDIREIYNLRALLESYGAGEAAIHRTEKQILTMEMTNKKYEEAIYQSVRTKIHRIKQIQEANQTFHRAIFLASQNEHLVAHIDKVVVLPLIYRSFYWYSEQQLEQSLKMHKIILQAIKDKEIDRAKIAMHEHIYQGRDHVIKNVLEA